MVSVNPTNENLFSVKTDLDDADRFKDLSLFIFQQNEHIVRRFMREERRRLAEDPNQTVENNLRNAPKKEIIVDSKVCTII